ncbi:hypothetical protein DSO57_1027373 [Entomophthora muscae]|uniref:Uncharacterized protein n=1 Tax=Entomophthora muscae TaxID=34485 RepID=A0ACC2UME1_9FUNG|nr:hypothetical protein DSO57_1027373 [Entomophthora muscae]
MISRGRLDFNQCSVKVIRAEPSAVPPLSTSPPPALAALLKEYKDVFSETLEQLPPSQEIQHAVQLQGLLPKALPLYCLTPKEDETLCQHLVVKTAGLTRQQGFNQAGL